jgi:hypothetical protein
VKYNIPVWRMIRNAVRAKGGAATNREIRDWVSARYPNVNLRTLRCQRVICTVNDPTRVNFTQNRHPRPATARYDFLFRRTPTLVEWYRPVKHGRWEIASVCGKIVARRIPAARPADKNLTAKPPRSWILVHAAARYAKTSYGTPIAELNAIFTPGLHWHWKMRYPMKEDLRQRLIYLAWGGFVFGHATACVTRKIDPAARRYGFTFAFVLHHYKKIEPTICLTELGLGSRAENHRGIVRLEPSELVCLQRKEQLRRKKRSLRDQFPDFDAAVDDLNRSHSQGFGLTATQRKAVCDYGMKLAKAELKDRDFEYIDTSHNKSFDLAARKDGDRYFAEVKASTGPAASIYLTANEVDLHQREYPNNILIVVSGIRLSSSGRPSGGSLHFRQGWKIADSRLEAIAYRYRR